MARQAEEREALPGGRVGGEQRQGQVGQLVAVEDAERGRRLGTLETRQPGGERRQPSVLADPAADAERRHGPRQHHRPRRDPALRAPHRLQAGHVDERHAEIDRLHPRGEVVERVEHPLERSRVGIGHAQLGPDQGEEPHQALTTRSVGVSSMARGSASVTSSGSIRRPSPNHRSSSAVPPASAQR